MGKLFLLFTLVPIAELYVLIQIGDALGGLVPVLMVVASGLLGAYLARSEGLRVFEAWRAALARGTLPSEGVVDGVLVLLGCLLLITPGVITDVAGIALLIRPLRKPVGAWVMRRVKSALERGTLHIVQQPSGERRSARPSVIDVEGESVSSETPDQLP